jgi:hypothetical protein
MLDYTPNRCSRQVRMRMRMKYVEMQEQSSLIVIYCHHDDTNKQKEDVENESMSLSPKSENHPTRAFEEIWLSIADFPQKKVAAEYYRQGSLGLSCQQALRRLSNFQ